MEVTTGAKISSIVRILLQNKEGNSMRTKAEFIESLRMQKPKVYVKGEKVENIVDHPLFRIPINSVAVECELINDPEYQDLTTKISSLINARVSRW